MADPVAATLSDAAEAAGQSSLGMTIQAMM